MYVSVIPPPIDFTIAPTNVVFSTSVNSHRHLHNGETMIPNTHFWMLPHICPGSLIIQEQSLQLRFSGFQGNDNNLLTNQTSPFFITRQS